MAMCSNSGNCLLRLKDMILQGDAGGVILGHSLTSCSNETMSPVQEIPYISHHRACIISTPKGGKFKIYIFGKICHIMKKRSCKRRFHEDCVIMNNLLPLSLCYI